MKTNLLIIGAGISGVSIAYNLAKKGMTGIHVVDKGYFTNGATGSAFVRGVRTRAMVSAVMFRERDLHRPKQAPPP